MQAVYHMHYKAFYSSLIEYMFLNHIKFQNQARLCLAISDYAVLFQIIDTI